MVWWRTHVDGAILGLAPHFAGVSRISRAATLFPALAGLSRTARVAHFRPAFAGVSRSVRVARFCPALAGMSRIYKMAPVCPALAGFFNACTSLGMWCKGNVGGTFRYRLVFALVVWGVSVFPAAPLNTNPQTLTGLGVCQSDFLRGWRRFLWEISFRSASLSASMRSFSASRYSISLRPSL